MTKSKNITLLIDTSGDEAGAALAKEGRVIAEERWESDPAAGRLLKEVDSLLKGAGKKMKDVRKIAVCEGPGRRYSALRTGAVTGMMLAYAEGVELTVYKRKSANALFGDIELKPQLVVIPEYEKPF